MMNPIVVIGGGIAGVTCAKVLSLDNPNVQIILLSASSIVKVVANLRTIGRAIDVFDVIEQNSSSIQSDNFKVIIAKVVSLNSLQFQIELEDKSIIKYQKLCICSGAKPKIIRVDNEKCKSFIKCIRDTNTAKDFQSQLVNSKKILLVGNGGIATELVYEVNNCEIIWVIKDKNFGATFFDSGVSKFFADFLNKNPTNDQNIVKRHLFETTNNETKKSVYGVALGPDWHAGLEMKGKSKKNVLIENNCEVFCVYNDLNSIPKHKHRYIHTDNSEHCNIYVELTNNKIYGCDMIVSATGVVPNIDAFIKNNPFKLSSDGGLWVDDQMRTNIEGIYAAGDVCYAGWKHNDHWFQMRLWTQARQMGFYASKCITSHIAKSSPHLYFNFEVFTHVTRFFGFRVILLGLYNGQKLKSNDYKILYRVVPQKEFIKVILRNGKMKGAILIGETQFEETFENLIYNQIDLSRFGDHLLDDILDVEDFFD